MKGFIIAAMTSGSGKTTVTTGIMRAMAKRGLKVMPFKTGPDYIDTRFHKAASGNESVNLDMFFSGRAGVTALFDRYARRGDVAVVEGVMGLFDGYDREHGSVADIADVTGLPVVMVIDASSAGYSLAAVLKGILDFRPGIEIAGVIFNNVASHRHLSLLCKAAEDAGVKMLGYVGRDARLNVPSRHLGLKADDDGVLEDFAETASRIISETVDIDAIYSLRCKRTESGEDSETVPIAEGKPSSSQESTIAVARDEAFRFIYPENLRSLERDPVFGGRILFFSPLHDSSLPEADFVYLPGGYPELYAEELSANGSMRESIREYVERGGTLWAECGGLMYLCQDVDGWEMCGVLPLHATMKERSLTLGYRTLRVGNRSFRGHEFHYSKVHERGFIKKIGCQHNVNEEIVPTALYSYKNTLAGYTHLYWGDLRLSDLWLETGTGI